MRARRTSEAGPSPATLEGAPPPASGAAVSARGLTHRFGELIAVDGVSLDIERGQVFGLVGPDGAGKSTLIRMLATVLAPDAGDALVFGSSVVTEPASVKPHIGYMSQRFSLYRDLTVLENVDFFADLRGVPRRERAERAERALEFAGLSSFRSRRAEYLSGGMKQKLALAVTLMHQPDLLLLDEPTTGVDPVSRREFWRTISDLHREGITVVVATPYMDEAERCGRVAFMDGGRIRVADTPAAIKARVPGRLLEMVAPDQRGAMELLSGVPGVLGVMVFGEALHVLVAHDGPTAEQVAATVDAGGAAGARVREARMDMETAFSFMATEAGSR